MRTRAARRDGNEREVIEALERCGWLVQPLSAPGVPDLLVCSPLGELQLIEVKDSAQPPSKRRLTPEQAAWHQRWMVQGAPVHVVKSATEALQAIGATSSRRQ
jgi:hypothetical protein